MKPSKQFLVVIVVSLAVGMAIVLLPDPGMLVQQVIGCRPLQTIGGP